jgi:CheY-like chemotaxis protein
LRRPRQKAGEPSGCNISGDFVPSSPKKIVAIVDDDPEMREATAALLSAFGYGTETFDSAEAFLIAAATSQASCIVTDIQLGDISGVELVHQLKADGYKFPNHIHNGARRRMDQEQSRGRRRHCDPDQAVSVKCLDRGDRQGDGIDARRREG